MRKILISAAVISALVVGVSAVAQNSLAEQRADKRLEEIAEMKLDEHCPTVSEETAAEFQELGIQRICTKIRARYANSILELPTEIITDLLPYPLNRAQVWGHSRGVLIFSIPEHEHFENHAICRLSRTEISEIPTPGRYLKHGWEALTEQSVNYGWILNRRSSHRGDTKLNVTPVFSFLPTENLEEATNRGLCADPAAQIVRWR